jgi:hypothetical protein
MAPEGTRRQMRGYAERYVSSGIIPSSRINGVCLVVHGADNKEVVACYPPVVGH